MNKRIKIMKLMITDYRNIKKREKKAEVEATENQRKINQGNIQPVVTEMKKKGRKKIIKNINQKRVIKITKVMNRVAYIDILTKPIYLTIINYNFYIC
jgi:hypothetical protein